MTTKVVQERRRQPRAAADLGMRFELPGPAATARVRNISQSGVRCHTDRRLPVMTQVQLAIALPIGPKGSLGTREITCRGVVVRCDPLESPAASAGDASRAANRSKYDTAIFFTDLGESDRSDVETFVSTAHRSDAT